MIDQHIADYDARFPALIRVACQLRMYVEKTLTDVPRIDRISSRAKEPSRFAAKAAKKMPNGQAKYPAPLQQIQDQLGARVIVFYKADVEVVSQRLERYLRHVERQDHVPDSYWEFGYFGRHWIFALPDDVIPIEVDMATVPRFFELQVKTLFQHAWSEANHDLCYKAPSELTPEQQRLFAYTAAQAWGADRVFNELREEIEHTTSGVYLQPNCEPI